MSNREVTISFKVDDTGSDGAFKRLIARINETGDASDKAVKKIAGNLERQLIVAFNKGGNREYLETIRRLAPEFQALQEQVKAGSFNLEDYNRRMKMLQGFTKDAIKQTNNLGEAFREIAVEAEDGQSTLKEMLGEFGGNMAARFVSALTDGLRQFAQQAVQAKMAVEQVSASISTIKDVNIKQVSTQLFEMSTRVPQSAQELGEGLYNIFSSVEATQSQAVSLLEKFAKGAVAARTDTETFGTAVLGVINAYKLELSEASHVSDVFFNVINKGVINGRELATNLGAVTQSAKNAGVDFDTLGGMIAGVTKEGGQAAQNVNNLSNLLMKMPTKEVTEGLRGMKIETLDSSGNFRPMLDVLTELKAKLDQMSPAMRALKLQELFPDAQARTGLATILSQLDFVKNATLENARAAGISEAAYNKMSGTAQAQFAILSNSIVAFMVRLSDWVTQWQVLGSGIGWISDFFKLLANNTGTVIFFGVTLAGLAIAFNAVSIAAATTAIIAYIKSLAGLWPVITNAANALRGLQGTFETTRAMATAATGGWIAIIGLVGVAIGALYSYYSASKEVKTANQEHVTSLTKLIDTTKEDITFLNDRNVSLKESAAAQQRYDSILKATSVTNQLTIKELGTEIEQRQALAQILIQQNDVRQEQLRSEALIAAIASKTKLEEAVDAEARITKLMAGRKKVLEDMKAGVTSYTNAIGDGHALSISATQSLEMFENQIANVSTASVEARKVLEEQVGTLAQMAIHANQTGLVFLQNNDILTTNTDAQAKLAAQMQKVIDLLEQTKVKALEAKKAIKDYAGEIQMIEIAKTDPSITDEYIRASANIIEVKLKDAFASGKDQIEILRQFKPVLDQLITRLQAGSTSTENLKARFNQLPEIIRKAYDQSREFGKTNMFEKTTKGAREAKKAISEVGAQMLQANFNKSLAKADDGMKRMIEKYADDYRIPRQLALAQIFTESRFKPEARSPYNKNVGDYAYGLTQQLPATASRMLKRTVMGSELQQSPTLALTAWGEYMTFLFKRYQDWDLAVLAYHQGEGTVDKLVKAYKQGKSGAGITGKIGNAYLKQISELSGIGGNQKFELAETAESRALNEIIETRARINSLITEGVDASQAEIEGLREQESNLRSILKTVGDINEMGLKEQLVFGLPETAEDARKLTDRVELLKTTLTGLRSQAEANAEKIFELGSTFESGASDVEKFDYQLDVLRASGKLTASDFELLADDIEKVRGQLIRISQINYAKKLRDDAKAVGDAFGQIAGGYKSQLLELKDQSPLNDFLKQVEGISELDFAPGALLAVKDLFSIGEQVDTEKFAAYIRQWLEFLAAIDMFDESKIDGVISKLRSAADGYNAFRKASTSIETQISNERRNLNEEFKDLQNEVTIASETSAERYRNAWLRAINDVKLADIAAVESQIESQVRIADQSTLHIEQIRADVLAHMADQKSLSESLADGIISAFDKAADHLDKRLGKLGEIPILGDLARFANRQFLSKVTTSLLDRFLPGMSEQFKTPTENLLTESKKQTKILEEIRDGKTGTPQLFSSSTASFGGISGSNVVNALGGFFGGGGRPRIVPFIGDHLSVAGSSDEAANDLDRNFGTSFGSGSTSLFDNLSNFFSTKENGLFAPRRNILTGKDSKWGGILGGIGSIATMIAPFLGGGRLSSVVGMAGQGAQIGAMFGPWGAGIGAAAGALIGLFTNPQRKADEQARTEYRDQATQALDQILSQLNARPPQINPPGEAKNQVNQLVAQYTAAANSLKDSKTRNIALAELKPNESIGYRVGQVDAAIANALKWQADEANRQKTSSTFTGQFAGGVFMDSSFRNQYEEFKRYNGMLGGTFTGRDYIRALIADGEVVANPKQLENMRRAAGFDVIAYAGLPNYKTASMPKFADGASFAAPVSMPKSRAAVTINVTVNGGGSPETTKRLVTEAISAALDSDESQRKIDRIAHEGRVRRLNQGR